jgi:hypothetical protein
MSLIVSRSDSYHHLLNKNFNGSPVPENTSVIHLQCITPGDSINCILKMEDESSNMESQLWDFDLELTLDIW